MDIRILHQIRMGFIVFTETAAILARMKTIRKGFHDWKHPMLTHYLLILALISPIYRQPLDLRKPDPRLSVLPVASN